MTVGYTSGVEQGEVSHARGRVGLLARAWRWLGATPVALKVFGLVVLPIMLVAIGGMLYAKQEWEAASEFAADFHIPAIAVAGLAREATLIFLIGAGIGMALSLILTAVLVHPLKSLVQAMRQVQAGDLDVQVPVWANDEIGAVQAEFNIMVDGVRTMRNDLLRQQGEAQRLCQENGRLLADLHAKNARLQYLLRHATTAQEEERKRLARELHDETGQALTSILLRLKVLQDETDLEVIQDRLNGLRYLTSQTLEEVRRLSVDLRPAALDDLGLVPALRGCVQRYAERSDVEMVFSAPTALARLSPEVEIILYRAVQEGLTNIVRHARARHASVSVERCGTTLRLLVVDDGVGFTYDASTGNGLAGMRERVLMAGGTLSIASQPGAGTRILIELPVEEVAV